MDEMTLLLREEKDTFANEIRIRKTGSGIRLKKKELRLLTVTLGRLLAGGVPILRALNILYQQASRPHPKKALLRIHEEVKEGRSLSDALRGMPQAFPFFYTQMVEIGESSGTLDQVLESLSLHLEQEHERSQRIREATVYPCFIVLSGMATLCVLMKLVIPKIVTVYQDFEGELPLMTQGVLAFSDAFPFIASFMLLGIGLLGFLALRHQDLLLRFCLKLPWMGRIAATRFLVRFASMFALLLQNGVTVLQAFDLVIASSRHEIFRKGLREARESVTQGQGIAESLQGIDWIPKEVVALLVAGEESGRFPETFRQIAKDGEKDFESQTQIMLKLLEPGLILAVGLVVGLIVISVLLPVFEMNELLF